MVRASLALLLLASCQSSGGEPDAPSASRAPTGKADGITAEGLRRWYLIGDGLTEGHDRLEGRVVLPSSAVPSSRWVSIWIDSRWRGWTRSDGEALSFAVDISELGPGTHQLMLAYAGATVAFFAHEFVRSYPLYVSVSNDWDYPDNPDATFARQEELHAEHPDLVLTYLVGPYTFTDPDVSEERRRWIVEWLTSMRDTYGDEIGLHIHPHCTFVEAAGVECRTEPSFVYGAGDRTGYTVMLNAYERDELSALFRTADAIFEEHGLGKPTSFRAGGWTADLHVLEAMAENGYLVDGSGMNWRRLEEWEGYYDATLYSWGRSHWATIDDTSQPYYPSRDDLLVAEGPWIDVLELPDNGLLVDYVSGAEMIEIFEANWGGGALSTPRAYSIGYHPPNFSDFYLRRMHEALTHVDAALAANDGGPAVYITMSELARVWPEPDAWSTERPDGGM